MKWTVASVGAFFLSFFKKKNPGEVLSVCLGSSALLLFYLDEFLCFGLEMKDHKTGILVFCKALGVAISLYVKSIKQF